MAKISFKANICQPYKYLFRQSRYFLQDNVQKTNCLLQKLIIYFNKVICLFRGDEFSSATTFLLFFFMLNIAVTFLQRILTKEYIKV